ncbi:ABC transporter permease subunit [Brachybacterium sp. J144]|uniref:ABC transporter permease n=1 Tax=Brachybacterium sp. J144 TaxID=3116487 RepID=UPI002E794141|nr:ABC transporter permease subunit [Brachybacterium sp. J144]MEE1649957.1 ABC transporter permease subunit [Brachybacterium sp. J144]
MTAATPTTAVADDIPAAPSLPARRPLPRWAIGVLGTLAVIAGWWILAGTVLSGVGAAEGGAIPTPGAILAQFAVDGWSYYARNASVTLAEAGLGYLAGNALALLLAAVVMLVPALERIITQLGVISYCLPLVAIGPIIFIVLGPPASGAPSGTAVVLAALSVFFTTLVGSILGLRSADRAALDVITVYGGTRLTQLRTVQVISALPSVLSSLKIAAPGALLGAVLGEYVGGVDRGLGPAMVNAQQSLEIERVWGVAIVCGLLAGGAFAVLALIARVATPWSAGTEGGRS